MCCGCRSAWGCSYCTNSSRIYSECLGELRRARNSEITSVRGFCVRGETRIEGERAVGREGGSALERVILRIQYQPCQSHLMTSV